MEKLSFNKYDSVYEVDFKNFVYPYTKKFSEKEGKFKLINGRFKTENKDVFSLQSVTYQSQSEHTLVMIKVDSGNSDHNILYIFSFEDRKLKLIQTFDFGDRLHFATAYFAHGELITEAYEDGFPQCCPKFIQRQHLKFKNGKYELIETQKISNNYVERKNRKEIDQ